MDSIYGLSSYQFRPNNGPCPPGWFKINFNTIVRPNKVYFAAMLNNLEEMTHALIGVDYY